MCIHLYISKNTYQSYTVCDFEQHPHTVVLRSVVKGYWETGRANWERLFVPVCV